MNWWRFSAVVTSLMFTFICWSGVAVALNSCARRADQQPRPADNQPAPESSALSAAKIKIKQSLDAIAIAEAKGDRLAKLQAEKDGLSALLVQKGEEERDVRAQLTTKGREIASEREAQAQARLYWLAGIMGFLSLVGGGVAVFVPMVSTWAVRFSMACGAVATLALFAAWLVPYLIWIGAALGLAGISAGVVWWYRDHKTARQVIAGVEAVKDRLPGYKEHFRQFIDEDADLWVDALRKKYHIQQVPKSPDEIPQALDLRPLPV